MKSLRWAWDQLETTKFRLLMIMTWVWALARDWHLLLAPAPVLVLFIAVNCERILYRESELRRPAEAPKEKATP